MQIVGGAFGREAEVTGLAGIPKFLEGGDDFAQ